MYRSFQMQVALIFDLCFEFGYIVLGINKVATAQMFSDFVWI